MFCTIPATEASRVILLYFCHTKVSFALVVVERDSEVLGKREDVRSFALAVLNPYPP